MISELRVGEVSVAGRGGVGLNDRAKLPFTIDVVQMLKRISAWGSQCLSTVAPVGQISAIILPGPQNVAAYVQKQHNRRMRIFSHTRA